MADVPRWVFLALIGAGLIGLGLALIGRPTLAEWAAMSRRERRRRLRAAWRGDRRG